MDWSKVRSKTSFNAAYLDLIEEGTPHLPLCPELAHDRIYRGHIAKVVWKKKGPVLSVDRIAEYDFKSAVWHAQAPRRRITVDLHTPEIMEPQLGKDRVVEVHSMSGFTVMIYPPKMTPPKIPVPSSPTMKDVLKIAGLL